VSFSAGQPYNELPLLPPAIELETKAVLKQAIAATRAVAQLRGMGGVLPNQGVLISSLLLQEAKMSSEIENIVTTNDELYRAFADMDGKTDLATKEVLHYQEALLKGYQALLAGRPLTTTLFVEIASAIKQHDMQIRRLPGTAIQNQASRNIVYTPPEGEMLIRDKLQDLERFLYADDDLDPLVKMAVAHYQFEAIHPFSDGNGRTGRILNILFLIDQGLLELPVLYLSQFIIEHKNAYYEGLRRVTEEGAWEDWIVYMLRAVEETARHTCKRITAIRALMDRYTLEIREKFPKYYSKDLVELLFRQPYCKIRFLEEAGIAKRQTASQYLQALSSGGYLHAVRRGREIYYINVEFFDLLTR
jgi:Fic family protein